MSICEIKVLDESNLTLAVSDLCQVDPHLRNIVDTYGPPPLWAREPGFQTMIHIILEQQVSLASALACFEKLKVELPELRPDSFLELNDASLLRIGFSRQKTRYSRILSSAILEGSLDVDGLSQMSDEEAFAQLTALTGIGPWTANIYLLMALGRPDVWPTGDLALEVAIQKLFGLSHKPKGAEFQKIAEPWRPYRAVAARILWHYYLSH